MCVYTWRKDEFTSVRSGGEGVERCQEEEAQEEQQAHAAAHNRTAELSPDLASVLSFHENERRKKETPERQSCLFCRPVL
jgi:hypothetical protein